MQINEYEQKNIPEDKIDFYYKEKSNDVKEILDYLRKHNNKLIGKLDDKNVLFSINDVYYFESVDKRTFAYLKKQVFRIESKLQDLESYYSKLGFIRVNKSVVLNIYKIEFLKSDFNMRVIAYLDNNEKVQINRSYKPKFNSFLKKMNEGGF
ncbi:LytTR family DNA-binding domain-containing protein [Clostridium niameyense]|uniref:LytTR family DNA-binding domain-containing protein n=1 Tax=Clostridium niameyense TaxID=1622073 RepID=UPI00067EDBD2|nr:LytTR family DNA-binding domain-containing protein [Clostridium niameyense]